MMNNNQIILMIIIHSIICLIYFAVNLKFKGLQDSLYKFFIIFFLPVAGLLFFAVSAILSKIPNRSDTIVDSYLKYIRGQKHIYYEEVLDFEKEINTVLYPYQFSDHYLIKKLIQRICPVKNSSVKDWRHDRLSLFLITLRIPLLPNSQYTDVILTFKQ